MAPPLTPDKRCPRCGETFPRSAFPRYWVAKRGHYRTASYCRDCRNAEGRGRYDPEKASIANRRWREQNADYHRLRQRRYAKANRESARRFRKRNPGYAAPYTARYRQRQRDATVERVERIVVLEMDDGICGICGEDVDPFRFHVDHIVPLSRGGSHSYSNVQVAHPSCNVRKSNELAA